MTKIRVAVLFGGRSSEHSVSCVSASGVMRALDQQKYDVTAIGISQGGRFHMWDLACLLQLPAWTRSR